jgi:hypothetical protein
MLNQAHVISDFAFLDDHKPHAIVEPFCGIAFDHVKMKLLASLTCAGGFASQQIGADAASLKLRL